MQSDVSRDGRLRVALVGQFGTGNLGNDASLLAAVAELRDHDPYTDILCLCFDPESVTKRYGLRAEELRSQPIRHRSRTRRYLHHVQHRVADVIRIYSLLKPLDVVIVPGSGYFEAGPMPAKAMPSHLFVVALAARLARTRFVIVSVGAEPAEHRSTRALLRWTLKLATYRSFRDGHSLRSAVGFGAPCDQDPIYPDLVFGLELPVGPVAKSQPHSVGIGVIQYRGPMSYAKPARRDAVAAAYVESMVSFVNWLIDRGTRVTLLTGDLKDEDVAEAVYDRVLGLRENAPVDIGRSDSFQDLLCHIRKVDYVIASRYHNIVAAVMTGKPVVSINYRAKNGEILDDLGLGRFQQPLEHLNEDRLREQFIDLQQSATDVAHMMATKTPIYRKSVARQWSDIKRELLRKTSARNDGL